MSATLPIAIIGAGPVGLAAAAHLVERRLPFVALEAGADAGAAVRQWGHVRLFSPWRDALPARGALRTGLQLLIDKGVVELAAGFKIRAVRTQPDGAGVELVALDKDGSERTIAADRVVAATGYRPDHTITGELRLDLDPILGTTRLPAPLIDPE